MRGRFQAFLLIAALMVAENPAYADNAACWGFGHDDPTRPDVTCQPLTPQLIAGLRRASLAHVIRALDAPGQPTDKDTLHFIGNAKGGAPTGEINVTFQHGFVAMIDASLDPAKDGDPKIRYQWSRRGPNCSDFPGSRRKCS